MAKWRPVYTNAPQLFGDLIKITGLNMIRDRIDNFMGFIKWPVACATVFFLPGAVVATLTLFNDFYESFDTLATPLILFGFGLFAYILLWNFILKRWRNSFLSTLEHELTHALFALLTFHPVLSIRATAKQGGDMSYKGRGNWLITISPYFFPTAPLLFAIIFLFVPPSTREWFHFVLGVTIGYHVVSTRVETHAGQTDLQRVGFAFSLMFLPTANILTHGFILVTAFKGGEHVGTFFANAWQYSIGLIGY